MTTAIVDALEHWAVACEITRDRLPPRRQLIDQFGGTPDMLRPAVSEEALRDWETRYDVSLPSSLRAWFLISNGFYREMPLIHPLSAIGPMVLFGSLPGMWVQPETWFELGNPNVETIGVDLAYRWPVPRGDCPIFTSGDQNRRTTPRVIAPSFTSWFLQLLEHGGREFWMEPGFHPLGDAWTEHRHHVPQPPIPSHLGTVIDEVDRLMKIHTDERTIAETLDLAPLEVEQVLRHLQHRPARSMQSFRPTQL